MPNNPSRGRKSVGNYSIRWDPQRARDAHAEGWWTTETLFDALRRAATQTPDRVLAVDDGQRLDCRTIHAQSSRLARVLASRMPAGSVVSFMLPNWYEAVVIYHAITLAGMVAHPVLPSMRDHELQFQLHDVGSRLIFIPAEFRNHDYVAMLDRIHPSLDPRPDVVVVRGETDTYLEYAKLLESDTDQTLPPGPDPDSVRLVMYTSGTTGRPKGVLHSHNSIHALMRQIGQHWLAEPGDTFLVPSPISHIGGSIYAFEAPVLLETTAVLMDRWEPARALRLAAAEHCTHICGATPFLEQLLTEARRCDEHLPTLKLFVCGGASVPPSLIRHATAHFSHAAVTRVYGSTEVPVTTVGCPNRGNLDHAADTDGGRGIAQIRLGMPTAEGDGEILVQGPQMFVGYLHPEDETSAFDAEGFYRTGDLGHWVDDDYLVVSGRSKDIIIRHGENISPKEIEDILIDHPGIEEVAVVGIPDKRTGERACAVIVPASSSQELDVEQLRSFLTARGLAVFKAPEQIVIRKTLPRNDAGKVLKHRIRTELTDTPKEEIAG